MTITRSTHFYFAALIASVVFALSYSPAFATPQRVCVTEEGQAPRCYTIEITTPSPNGTEPSGPPPAPTNLTISGSAVSGKAEPKSNINAFTTSTGLSCSATADDSGNFSCNLNGTPTGGELIYVTATNSKGTSPVGRARAAGSSESRGFLREGLFGCQAGQYGMSVGTLQAIGGVYVPVNDAAVTLNTGYLVYKECVLDGVIVRMREAASAAIVKSIINAANKGRGGSPEYPVEIPKELQDRADETLVEFLKNYNLKNICAPFQQDVKVAIAKQYMLQTRDPNNQFRCSLGLPPSDVKGFLGGNSRVGSVDDLRELFGNTNNTPLGAYVNTTLEGLRRINTAGDSLFTQIGWGNGNYPREERFAIPTDTGETAYVRRTLTPGFVISQILAQAVGSGYRQLENANEVDQIVNALFSGITNQVMSDIRGLTGLSETRLGKAPYLDQLSAEASAGLRESASNAALTVLNSSIAVEQEYNGKKRGIKSLLDEAASQLRNAETQCWVKVVEAVTNRAKAEGVSIRVSTSTTATTGGTIALKLPAGATVPAQQFSLAVAAASVIESGSFTFSVTTATTSAAEQAIGFTITGTQPAPPPGGTISLTGKPPASFGTGTLSLKLRAGQTLPVGDVRFSLTPVSPFSQAAVSVIVDVARQFADKVIDEKIGPLLESATNDLNDSNQALQLIVQLANDLRNTTSLTAQRIALERIDTLIAQHAIHTAYDVKQAAGQLDDLKTTLQSLIEDTVHSWTDGDGWCNVNNANVVKQWLDKWRI